MPSERQAANDDLRSNILVSPGYFVADTKLYVSMSVARALKALSEFQGESLTTNLAEIERSIVGLGAKELSKFCGGRGINHALIDSAASIKRLAAQINVIIHAAGILCSLQELLDPGEVVESVSLGAGNTGRKFDLETNRRIAEYKFIDWRGGPESIRQNSIFMDFYALAEYRGRKDRYLYVVDTHYPLQFLNGGRALTSVLSRAPTVHDSIRSKYGPEVLRVRDYYQMKKGKVAICDISPFIGRDV